MKINGSIFGAITRAIVTSIFIGILCELHAFTENDKSYCRVQISIHSRTETETKTHEHTENIDIRVTWTL